MKNILVLLTIFLSTTILAFAQPNDYCITQSSCTSTFIQRADTIPVEGFPGSWDIVIYKYRICDNTIEFYDEDVLGHYYTPALTNYYKYGTVDWAAMFLSRMNGIADKIFMIEYNKAPNKYIYNCPNGYISVKMYVSSCMGAVGFINSGTGLFDSFRFRACSQLCCQIETRLCYNLTTGKVDRTYLAKTPMWLGPNDCTQYSVNQDGTYNFFSQSCSPTCE